MAGRKYKARQKKRKQMVKYNGGGRIGKAITVATKAAKLASMVYRVVNAEEKYEDTSQTAASLGVAGAPTVIGLTQIARETTAASDTVRSGDSIKALSLKWRGFFQGASSVGLPTVIRAVLVQGNNERGTSPAWLDVFQNNNLYSPKNHDYRFNTKILYDKMFVINMPSSGTVQAATIFQDTIKLTHHIQYADTATTPQNGGLYFMFHTNKASEVPALSNTFRFTYTDN